MTVIVHGDTMPLDMLPLLERIKPGPNGCWLWTGAKSVSGYGHVRYRRKVCVVHRVVYELLVGPIPDGLVLDHLCRVRHCCAPTHLEPVTDAENIARGAGLAPQEAARTHCPAGHAYDEVNTYVTPTRPNARYCRACHNERSREWRARNPR